MHPGRHLGPPPRVAAFACLLAAFTCGAPSGARAQASVPTDFADQLVVDGLANPTAMAMLPDGRLLVVEQFTAAIRLVIGNALGTGDPVGVVPDVSTNGSERGLLGIAVDPRWPAKPYIYVHYTSTSLHVRVSRFTLTGDIGFTGNGALALGPGSRYDLVDDLPDNAYNHNGGTLRFGPDEMLYGSFGEDASPCAAQDTISGRGVILRMDVRGLPDGPGTLQDVELIAPMDNPFAWHPNAHARLVWVRGLRNPFRFQIDPADGALWIADVGQSTWEELDRAEKGANCGWPLYEGNANYSGCAGFGAAAQDLTFPVATYSHAEGLAIMCIGVYRHAFASAPYRFPSDYRGDVFFGDYYTGIIRRLSWNGAAWLPSAAPGQPTAANWATGAGQLVDGLIGPDGGLWYLRQGVNYGSNTGQVRAIRYIGIAAAPDGGRGVAFAPPVPNPARGQVRFAFTLPAATRVRLTLHDAAGRLVRTLVPATALGAGSHEREWDGRDEVGRPCEPGMYFARLEQGESSATRRFALAH